MDITVATNEDTDFESDETFLINLSAPTNNATTGTATVEGNITNDDTPVPPGISANLRVENDASDGNYDVSWDAPAAGGPVDYYELEERVSLHDGTWSRWVVKQSTLALTYPATSTEGTYQYRVTACNAVCGDPTTEITMQVHTLEGIGSGSAVGSDNAAGNMPYNTRVTPSGGAVVTVPVQAVPGVNGLQPNLSVSYSSSRGSTQLDQELPEDTLAGC